jgi:hypothetical protein
VIGQNREKYRGTVTPDTYEQVDESTFDAQVRLKIMDDLNVWAQVVFPNVAGFGNGSVARAVKDRNYDAATLPPRARQAVSPWRIGVMPSSTWPCSASAHPCIVWLSVPLARHLSPLHGSQCSKAAPPFLVHTSLPGVAAGTSPAGKAPAPHAGRHEASPALCLVPGPRVIGL